MKLGVVILAAGQGTRMCSDLPKILHRLAGRPLLAHVAETANRLNPQTITVVYGHGGRTVPESLPDLQVNWVEQSEQLGTAHAVAQALPHVGSVDQVLVLYGDVPLISVATLDGLRAAACDTALGLLTMRIDDPSGYGRIVRDQNDVIRRIVEQKDASESERGIREVSTGILLANREPLQAWIEVIDNDNTQGEYYLTDVVSLAVAEGVEVHATSLADPFEAMGVNDRVQLAALERHLQTRQAEALMRQGATLSDPARFDLRGQARIGRDVEIDVNVILEGDAARGDTVKTGP